MRHEGIEEFQPRYLQRCDTLNIVYNSSLIIFVPVYCCVLFLLSAFDLDQII